MDGVLDLLSNQPFLAGLTSSQLEQLSAYATSVQLPAAQRLFDEGGRADRFWIIQRGRVALDTEVPGRGDVVLETLGAGAVLGWSWLFSPYRWHFGATCVERTDAIELNGPGVLELCGQDPALGFQLATKFVAVVVQRLQATRVRLLDLYGDAS